MSSPCAALMPAVLPASPVRRGLAPYLFDIDILYERILRDGAAIAARHAGRVFSEFRTGMTMESRIGTR